MGKPSLQDVASDRTERELALAGRPWLRGAWALLLPMALWLVPACQEDLGIEDRLFTCERDDQCAGGMVCGGEGLCVAGSEGLVAAPLPADSGCPAPANAYRRTLSSGDNHVCYVQSGSLVCWGDNAAGQLGSLSGAPSLAVPTEVVGSEPWIHVTAGADHTCALGLSQTLYCWGGNGSGQLGDGTKEARLEPVAIAPGQTWSTVSAGSRFTCGITTDEDLYCWGSDGEGRLGLGNWEGPDQPSPKPLGELGSQWLAVTTGRSHGCALQTDGSLWCWSGSQQGEEGSGTGDGAHVPTRIESGLCWWDVTATMHASLALSSDGRLWAFGGDGTRRLPVDGAAYQGCPADPESDCLLSPTAIISPGPWRHMALGWWHGAAIHQNGTLWGWGGNGDQEGPFGVTEGSVYPPMDATPEEATQPFDQVVIGTNHTCALDGGGEIWCAGRNGNGQLGRGFSGGSEVSFGKVLLP